MALAAPETHLLATDWDNFDAYLQLTHNLPFYRDPGPQKCADVCGSDGAHAAVAAAFQGVKILLVEPGQHSEVRLVSAPLKTDHVCGAVP